MLPMDICITMELEWTPKMPRSIPTTNSKTKISHSVQNAKGKIVIKTFSIHNLRWLT